MQLPIAFWENVRAVCFDAVGTLIFPDPPAPVVYAEVGACFGSRLDEDKIRERFRHAFAVEEQRDKDDGWRTSEEREVRRWRQIVTTVLDDTTDPKACFQALYHHFSNPRAWRCCEHAGEVLDQLAARFPLALASNYDHRLCSVIAGLPELQAMGHVIISSEVGWRKPAAPFFTAICRELALPPEQMLYVGDDLVNDYFGACSAGLMALLFNPGGKEVNDVRHLSDLRQLVEAAITGTHH
jgi:putative hydrolase of the HAD superfamily